MKKDIHPKLHRNAKVTDLSSGETFTLASTKEEISVEVTNLTHPFYTGKHRIVDTENLVKKFESKRTKVDTAKVQSKKEKIRSRRTRTSAISEGEKLTLKDMLSQFK